MLLSIGGEYSPKVLSPNMPAGSAMLEDLLSSTLLGIQKSKKPLAGYNITGSLRPISSSDLSGRKVCHRDPTLS